VVALTVIVPMTALDQLGYLSVVFLDATSPENSPHTAEIPFQVEHSKRHCWIDLDRAICE
jgi:hypothetical protein